MLDFANYDSTEEAEKAIALTFPPKRATRQEVETKLKEIGFSLFPVGGSVLNVKLQMPSRSLVHAVWMIRFEFDPSSQLLNFKVKKGFVGP